MTDIWELEEQVKELQARVEKLERYLERLQENVQVPGEAEDEDDA